MEIFRNAYNNLAEWKNAKDRKPMLIRGARQVGKTTLVRAFSKNYSSFIELNLEKETERELFELNSVDKIFNAACLLKNISPEKNSTLFFIDEIQESPKAIQALRFFYEEKPDLHVVAAGSLLEFALKKVPAFPVGRINYLYLHPVNFEEYLLAKGNTMAIEQINAIPPPSHTHSILLELFHEYALIGGMPEIVRKYLEDNNLPAISGDYQNLWQSFKDDVEKYSYSEEERKIIRHVISTAPYEKDRIKFERFGNSNYRSREVGKALRALDLARIIMLIYPTTVISPPISTDFRKRPRLQFVDTGLLNHILDLQAELIKIKDLDNFYQGKIIQHLVTQELISVHTSKNYKPHFWVRESKSGSAEVDIVIQRGPHLIPIEIKAGKQGKLKSLHQFINRSPHPYAIRIYAGKFSIEKHVTPEGKAYFLMNLPYYLSSKIPELADYLINNYFL